MRIVHAAAEMAPLAKIGGLGDMVGGIAKELSALNQDTEVIIPRYGFLKLNDLSITPSTFKSFENGIWHENKALHTTFNKSKLTLIEPQENIPYFNYPNIYGYENDPARFIYFCRSLMDYLLSQNQPIDILHIHDWHTSLCAVLYKDLYKNQGLKINKIVLNIHNVEYQGFCSPDHLDRIGLNSNQYSFSMNIMINTPSGNRINLLKGGINYSDAIVAVSPSYSEEILSSKYGYGLEEDLKNQKHKLHGILNGIDNDVWDPKTDPVLSYHYTNKMKIEAVIKNKKKNKEELQKKLGLPTSNKPLFCSIGRLVRKKGPELIEFSISSVARLNGQFVLLGNSLIGEIQTQFSNLAEKYKSNRDIHFSFTFDEKLAHLLYGASDFIVIPSLFEPCGLTQFIALRYGTIPIVRKTGGLKDSVFDIDDPAYSKEQVNGLTFDKFSTEALDNPLNRAFHYYKNNKDILQNLIKNGMNSNHSLKKTAKEYLLLYQQILSS